MQPEVNSLNSIAAAAGVGVAIEATKLITDTIQSETQNRPRKILNELKPENLVQITRKTLVDVALKQNYAREVLNTQINDSLKLPDLKMIKAEGAKPSTLSSVSFSGHSDESDVPSGRYTFFERERNDNAAVIGFYLDLYGDIKYLRCLNDSQSSLNPINPVVTSDGKVVYSAKPQNKYFETETPASAIYINDKGIPIGVVSSKYSRFGKGKNGMAYMMATPRNNPNILSCYLVNTKTETIQKKDIHVDNILQCTGFSELDTIRSTPWFVDNNTHWLMEVSTFDHTTHQKNAESIIVVSSDNSGRTLCQNLLNLVDTTGDNSKNKNNLRIIDIVEYIENNKINRIAVCQMTSSSSNERKFLVIDEEGRAVIVNATIEGKFIKSVKPHKNIFSNQMINSIKIWDNNSSQTITIPKFSKNCIKIL